MDFAKYIADTKKDIGEMQTTYKNPSTSPQVKEMLKESISRAQQQLANAEADYEKAKKQLTEKAKKQVSKKAGRKPKTIKIPVIKAPAAAVKERSKRKSVMDKINELLDKPAVNKFYKKSKSVPDLSKDAERKAKSPGARISASGNPYFESRPNRSDIHRRKFPYLEKGGPAQAAPQSENYDYRRDKGETAKAVGYRYTDEGAKRLNVSPYKKPTQEHIDKYKDKEFTLKGKKHRYLYYETRKDKSDKSLKAPRLEYGGDVMPSHNINVYGYETQAFDISQSAVDYFNYAVDRVETEYDHEDVIYTRLSNSLKSLAECLDEILKIQKRIMTGEQTDVNMYDMQVITRRLILCGAWHYKAGYHGSLNWLDENILFLASHFSGVESHALGGEVGDIYGNPLNDFRFDIQSPEFKQGGNIPMPKDVPDAEEKEDEYETDEAM